MLFLLSPSVTVAVSILGSLSSGKSALVPQKKKIAAANVRGCHKNSKI